MSAGAQRGVLGAWQSQSAPCPAGRAAGHGRGPAGRGSPPGVAGDTAGVSRPGSRLAASADRAAALVPLAKSIFNSLFPGFVVQPL